MTIHTPTILSLDADDAVRCGAIVPVGRAAAFERFRHNIAKWWPRELTWSGSALEDLFLEGRRGGMLWERGPEGFRLDWARVLRWLPPERIVLRWHVGPGRVPQPDIASASEVDVQFFVEGAGQTRIEIEHRGFACHGAGASEYHSMMGSPEGWPNVLKHYVQYCESAAPAREAPRSAERGGGSRSFY